MTTSAEQSKSLLRIAGKAIADYDMARPSDCILVGVAGGTHSLSSLHLLLYFQCRTQVCLALSTVVHVQPSKRDLLSLVNK